MKLYDASVVLIIVVAVAAAIGLISAKFLGPDNPIEEAAESIIKEEIGADVDLSFSAERESLPPFQTYPSQNAAK